MIPLTPEAQTTAPEDFGPAIRSLSTTELDAVSGGVVEGGCITFPIRFPVPWPFPSPIADRLSGVSSGERA